MVHIWFITWRFCAQENPSKSNKCKKLTSRKPVLPRASSEKNHGTTMVTLRCYEVLALPLWNNWSFWLVVESQFEIGGFAVCVLSALGYKQSLIDITMYLVCMCLNAYLRDARGYWDVIQNRYVYTFSVASVCFYFHYYHRYTNLLW